VARRSVLLGVVRVRIRVLVVLVAITPTVPTKVALGVTAMGDGTNSTIDRMGKSWASAGARHGTDYGDPFSVEVDRAMGRSVDNSTNLWRNSNLMRFPLEAIEKLADDMPNILGRGADQAGPRIRQSFGDTFSNIGQGLSAMLSNAFGGSGGGSIFKALTDGADQASHAFTMLFSIGQLVGSALVGLVAGIANVVSGLFAMASAASAAAPALAVLPGLLAAIAQGGITLLVGFKGVGQAISAGMKEAANSTGTASARSRELATAQRAVESASRSLQSAEKAAANAKKDLADAQKNLNDAYKEGAKQLRDIQYAAEDAALQEERSAINLANARDELARVKATNPGDSRAVQEAELAYKEADLAYREARSRNKDASEEANDATKKGVKGTQAVVSAQDRLIRAQENVANSNQRVADSQRALADAQQRLADTQSGAIGSANAYNKALEKFGPNGQKFIKTIVGMRGQFKGLKEAAGESTFAALTDALNELVSGPFFGILKKNFQATGDVIAKFVTGFSDMIQEAGNMRAIDRIMQSNTAVLGSFSEGAIALGRALITILDAAHPVTEEFARWLSGKVVKWSNLLAAKNAAGELTPALQKAAGVAKTLGKIFGNVFSAIFNTGKAAQSGGATILDWLEEATGKWDAWTKSVGGQNELKKYFDDVAANFGPILQGVTDIVKELLKLGGDKKLGSGVASALETIASLIEPAGKAVSSAMPMFERLGKALGTIINTMQESGALDTFVAVLTTVAETIARVVSAVANWEGFSLFGKDIDGKKIIYFAGAIMGVVRALRFLQIGFSFLGKATIGKFIKNIGGVVNGFKLLGKGENPFGDATKGSEEARKEFIKQMKIDKLKMQAMEGVGEGAKIAAKHHMDVTEESKDTRAEFTKQMKVDKLKKDAMEKVGKAGKHAADGIAESTKASKKDRAKAVLSRITGNNSDPTGKREKTTSRGRSVAGKLGKGLAIGGAALGGVGLAVGALAAVATLNKDSAAALGTQISDMAKNLPTALAALAGQIPQILSAISGAIGPLIGTIADALPGVIDSIVKAMPQVIGAISKALPKVLGAIIKILPVVINALAKLLPLVITTIVKLVPVVITALVKLIPQVITALVKLVPLVITALATAIPQVIVALAEAIPVVIKALADAIPVVVTALADAIPQVIEALVTALPVVIDALITAVPLIIDAVITALPLIIEALIKAIPQIIGAIIKAIPQIISAVIAALPKIVQAIIAALPKIFGALANAFKLVLGPIKDFFSGALEKVKTGMTAAKNWIVKKWGEVLTFFNGLPGKLASKVVGLFDGIKTAFKGAVNWIIRKWNDLQLTIGGQHIDLPFGRSFDIPSITLSTPDLPYLQLAQGGTVAARAGGALALIGEAGRNEVVKPLDGRGMTASDRLITAMIAEQGKQLSLLVAALTTNGRAGAQLTPAVASTAATAAVVATQRTLSSQGGGGAAPRELVSAITSLTDSVDSLQRPLIGGNLNVTAAPGERADISVPAMLRRRAYTRPGAR